jgi:hypothetical protein
MMCQACGRAAATRHVVFYQNIGLILLRLQRKVDGHLCRPCIRKYFLQTTLVTLVLGWWGVISFVFTLFILPHNVIRFLGAYFARELRRPDAVPAAPAMAPSCPNCAQPADPQQRFCRACGAPLLRTAG